MCAEVCLAASPDEKIEKKCGGNWSYKRLETASQFLMTIRNIKRSAAGTFPKQFLNCLRCRRKEGFYFLKYPKIIAFYEGNLLISPNDISAT